MHASLGKANVHMIQNTLDTLLFWIPQCIKAQKQDIGQVKIGLAVPSFAFGIQWSSPASSTLMIRVRISLIILRHEWTKKSSRNMAQ